MKKVLLTTLLAIAGLGMIAQKLDKVKDLVDKKKYAEAKTEIDAVLADPKNAKSADAWFYKGKIYAAIAADNTLSSQTPDARVQAFEALKKSMESDDKHVLMILDNYKTLSDIYQGFFGIGASQYKATQNADAFASFKNCLAVSDYMIANKLTTLKLDTTVILYTGITAEKSGKKDDAAIYYARLADAKINGENNDQIYGWLTGFYMEKKRQRNCDEVPDPCQRSIPAKRSCME